MVSCCLYLFINVSSLEPDSQYNLRAHQQPSGAVTSAGRENQSAMPSVCPPAAIRIGSQHHLGKLASQVLIPAAIRGISEKLHISVEGCPTLSWDWWDVSWKLSGSSKGLAHTDFGKETACSEVALVMYCWSPSWSTHTAHCTDLWPIWEVLSTALSRVRTSYTMPTEL